VKRGDVVPVEALQGEVQDDDGLGGKSGGSVGVEASEGEAGERSAGERRDGDDVRGNGTGGLRGTAGVAMEVGAGAGVQRIAVE